MPAWLLPAIGMGAGLFQNLFNTGQQRKANEQERQFALGMYNRQRSDALADWQMQNEYNSPAAQMQRFKDAKLNPNLIYGQMSQGATVRTSSPGNYSPRAPQVETSMFANSLMAMYDLMLKQAQTDNLKAAADLTRQQREQVRVHTASEAQEMGFRGALFPTSLEQARETLRKTMVETTVISAQNERAALLNAQTLMKGVQEILLLKLQQANMIQDNEIKQREVQRIEQMIELAKKENIIKQFDVDLTEQNKRPGDGFIFRKAQGILNLLEKAARWLLGM